MVQGRQVAKAAGKSAAHRSQQMAIALSSYARALTFENRSRRNLYRLAGLAPRLRDQVFDKLLIIAFVVCFALPFSVTTVYYLLLASPQFATEARFVVRSSVPLLSRDRYSSANLEPKEKIVQDTAVLLNYLGSPAMVRDLQENIDINILFGRGDIDYLSRLPSDAKQEELTEYWEGMISSSVSPKSGIVELEVRAFSAQESYDLLQLVMKLAEERVNRLNSGIWDNLFKSASADVEAATRKLETLRARFRDTQNQTGVYDIELAAENLHTVLTKLEGEIATMKSERAALSESVAEDSPKVAVLDRQIAARIVQAKVLQEQIAGGQGGEGQNLADTARLFEQLKLDVGLAEDRLASAIGELEKVKLVSALQLVYLDQFTEPVVADKAAYPRTSLALFLSLLAYLAIWGAVAGTIILARNKVD